jgi:hypothetical protein
MALPVPTTLHLSGTVGQNGFNNFPVEAQYPSPSNVMYRPGDRFSTLSFKPLDYGFLNDGNPITVTVTEIHLTPDTHKSGINIESYTLNGITTAASFPLSLSIFANDTLSINFICTTWWLSGGGGEIGVGGKNGEYFGDTNAKFTLTQSGVTGVTDTLIRVSDPSDLGIYDRWPVDQSLLYDLNPGSQLILFRSEWWNIYNSSWVNEFSSEFVWSASFTATDVTTGLPISTNFQWSQGTFGRGQYSNQDTIQLVGTVPQMFSTSIDITMTFERTRNESTMPGATHCLNASGPRYQLINPARVSFTRRIKTVDAPELRAPTKYTTKNVSSSTELTNKDQDGITMTGGFTGLRNLALVCKSHPLDPNACVGFLVNGNPATATNHTINGKLAKVIKVANGDIVKPIVQTPPFDDNNPEAAPTRTFQLIPFKYTVSNDTSTWIQAEWSISQTLVDNTGIAFTATTNAPNVGPWYFNEFHRTVGYPANEIVDIEVPRAGQPYEYNISSTLYNVAGLGTDAQGWRGAVSWVKLRPHASNGYVDYQTDPILRVYENSASTEPKASGRFVSIENGNKLVLYARNPASYVTSEQFEIIFGCRNPSQELPTVNLQYPFLTQKYNALFKYIKRTARPRNDIPVPALAFNSVTNADPGVPVAVQSTQAIIGFDEMLKVSINPNPATQDMTGWTYSLQSSEYITPDMNLPITVLITPPVFPGTGSIPFGQQRTFTVSLTPVDPTTKNTVSPATVTTASFVFTVRQKSDNVSTIPFPTTTNAIPGQYVRSDTMFLTGFDGQQQIYFESSVPGQVGTMQIARSWDSLNTPIARVPASETTPAKVTVNAGNLVYIVVRATMGFYPDTQSIYVKQIQNGVPVVVGTWVINTKACDDTKLLVDF